MPATTPTVNKLQLGSLVRHFREQAGLTQEQLGGKIFPRASVKSAQNKIALVESGQGGIHPADLSKLLELCEVGDPDMLALIEQMHTNTSQRGRWGGYRAVYAEAFRKHIDLEEDASVIRQVEVEFCPDLIQCESYIRALFAPGYDEGFFTADFEQAVQARLARGLVLQPSAAGDSGPVSFRVVLSESCLRRVIGNREVMREQVSFLVGLSKLPNINLQIVPFTARVVTAYPTFDRFSMFRIPAPGVAGDLEFVYLSNGNDPRYLDDKTSVEIHDRKFEDARASALRPDESRRFLKEIERDFRLM
jgi:transcriptional regulator with XRE-family HTH domain